MGETSDRKWKLYKIKCSRCRSWVRNKPILGTLHFCLTDEEIERARAERDMEAAR